VTAKKDDSLNHISLLKHDNLQKSCGEQKCLVNLRKGKVALGK